MMISQSQLQSHDFLVAHLLRLLGEYERASPGMSVREQTLVAVRIYEATRDLGIAIGVRSGFSATGARERIKSYLEAHPRQVIDGMELAVISGISEYGRRVRELRKAGLNVATGPDAKDPTTGRPLLRDQYVFSPAPGAEAPRPFRLHSGQPDTQARREATP